MKRALYVRTLSVSLLGAVGMFAQTVPPAYQDIYNTLTTQISAFQNTVNASWNGTPYAVNWAPHLSSAESDEYLSLLSTQYYSDTVLVELQQLQATGAKAVTVHINFPVLYQPFYTYTNTPSNYENFVKFYQELVRSVHSRGMKLVVEATVSEALDGTQGSAFDPYYQTLDWNDYMTGRAQNAVNVAELIKPDYLSLICEPDSESVKAYQPTENTPAGALQLLQTNLTALQQAGVTGVTLGAGAGTWISDFTTYLQEFSGTSLNYIDMHVYPVNNSDFTNVLTGAALIKQSGKQVAVSEAWPEKISNAELGSMTNINTIDSRYVFSFWAPVDTAFFQAMVDVAQYEQFLFMGPSFPEYFAAYLDYGTDGTETSSQLLSAADIAGANANHIGAFTPTGRSFSTMISGVDKTPPTTPALPSTTGIGPSTATLTWSPTHDNVGVAGYNIYRDGALVSQLSAPPFYDTALVPGVTYLYSVSAFDVQGNVSAQSAPLSVLTVDTTAPSVPQSLQITSVGASSVSLKWAASTGAGGVGGYRVLKGTSPSAMTITDGYDLETSYTDPYATPGTTYYYAVEAYNPIGVTSAPSATVTTKTSALLPPTNLKTVSLTVGTASLSWKAPAGSAGTEGYRILKGTTPTSLTVRVGKNPGTSYTDTPLEPGTTYYYQVETIDSEGTASAPSATLTVTVPK